ncbi:SDR family NAD(P)-dependent oxidoreductase [Erwinia papayae]|uniref:SDR family NAD(P)-dependent oxidoreductase n=1 Tax=Erwinia papayae TaxID=206499 RepID=A0ABV3N2E6_9GAMM
MSQVWIVTGSSRGLGLAIAQAALAAGHRVIATSRNGQLNPALKQYEDKVLAMPLDVKSAENQLFEDIIAQAVNHFGRIDVLVNNAGYGQLTHFEETDEEQIRSAFETNVMGLMRMTRSVLPVMRKQQSGHVINISSVAGYCGGGAVYSATKFAVTGFTTSLAQEVASFGIKVTNVAPGFFRTDFLDRSSVQMTSACLIEDYESARQWRHTFIEQANHNQGGDPAALGRLLVEIAAVAKPPVHLPVGEDAIRDIVQYQQALSEDINAWQDKSGKETAMSLS